MYNELRAKVQALIEDADVEKATHSMAKSVSDYKEVDDEDIEDAVSAYNQELITNGLDDEHSGGSKAASEKQIDEAADSLLESITVK